MAKDLTRPTGGRRRGGDHPGRAHRPNVAAVLITALALALGAGLASCGGDDIDPETFEVPTAPAGTAGWELSADPPVTAGSWTVAVPADWAYTEETAEGFEQAHWDGPNGERLTVAWADGAAPIDDLLHNWPPQLERRESARRTIAGTGPYRRVDTSWTGTVDDQPRSVAATVLTDDEGGETVAIIFELDGPAAPVPDLEALVALVDWTGPPAAPGD